MSVIMFLQRLTGTSHEGLREQTRFEHNIRSVQAQERELDKMQEDMAAIVQRVVRTQRRIKAASLPSGASGEHALVVQTNPPGAPNGDRDIPDAAECLPSVSVR